MTQAQRARSFDAWADDYDRYRPSYPPALFDLIATRLALPTHPAVADLGAGTGRASLAMAKRGWRVTAVEPGAPMLAVLRERAAIEGLEITTHQAHAETTGLAGASMDLATVAQAYHWLDPVAGPAEMGRIVRPGGGIALFWNVRDADASSLLEAYNEHLRRYGIDRDTHSAGPRRRTQDEIAATGAFEEPTFEQVRHTVAMTSDAFIGLAFTASYVQALDADARARFRAEVETLVGDHNDGRPELPIPYIVDCWIAKRRNR